MATIAPVRRLWRRVRRPLAEHDITGRAVPGTGSGGRVTPRDVLSAVRLHHDERVAAADARALLASVARALTPWARSVGP